MTIKFDGYAPHDILIERMVDQAIAEGCRVPRWGWPVPGPYNGATGRERVIAWQKVRIAEDMGLLGARHRCGMCGAPDAPQWHTEIYARSLTSRPVCRSCHLHIHQRFKRPNEWRVRIKSLDAQAWVHSLHLIELSRQEAMEVAHKWDVFGAMRALLPHLPGA